MNEQCVNKSVLQSSRLSCSNLTINVAFATLTGTNVAINNTDNIAYCHVVVLVLFLAWVQGHAMFLVSESAVDTSLKPWLIVM